MSTRNETDTDVEMMTGELPVRMTNDLLFKHLLQDDTIILKGMIRDILHLDESEPREVSVTNPILMGQTITDKNVILDVNVLMNNNSHLDLEMQVIDYKDWVNRSLVYVSRNFDDLRAGDDYSNLRPSIQIGFLNFRLFPEHPKFFSVNRMMDIEDHYEYSDMITVAYIDMTNIDMATDTDRRFNIDKWARFFKAKTWEELQMIAEANPAMEEAVSHLKELTAEERFRQECWAREDQLRRERGMKRRLDEALARIEEADRRAEEADKRADDEAKRADDEAKRAREADRHARETEARYIRSICKMLRNGKTAEQISDDLDDDYAHIKSICDAAAEFAPEYDAEKVISKILS